MEKLFLFTNDSDRRESIKKIADGLGAKIKFLSSEDLTTPLERLIFGTGPCKGKENLPPIYSQPEIMFMSGFTSERIDSLIDEFKKQGVKPVDLKAIVTPVNVKWSPYELTKELIKERNSFISR